MGLLRDPNVAVTTSGTNDWNNCKLVSLAVWRSGGLAPKQYASMNLHRR